MFTKLRSCRTSLRVHGETGSIPGEGNTVTTPPPFTEFVQFIKNAADKANIPELQSVARSQDRQHSGTSDANVKSSRGKKAIAFATTTNQSEKSRSSTQSDGNSNKVQSSGDDRCYYCKKRHSLDECNFKERREFFFQRRFCVGCSSAVNHQVKDCQ